MKISNIYDAFGNQKSGTGTWNNSNPIRYCGEYYDKESGLIYRRARYYDSEEGRFLSEDPAKDGYNWYSYCGSNPVNGWDPSGYITKREQEMYENGQMSPTAYSYLMLCTYQYYLSKANNDIANENRWHDDAEKFRNSGYTDTGNPYWNNLIVSMPNKPTGNITKEEHYFRNNLNIQYSWDDFQKIQNELPENLKWRELPLEQSILHKFGQANNRKYVSACGHFEVVYTKENYLVNENFSNVNMGTYNYYSPVQAKQHAEVDVVPWVKWGNTPNG